MPLFKYRAQNKDGEEVKGRLDAANEIELQQLLKEDGLALLDAKAARERTRSARALHPKVLSSFCFKLSELLGSGVSLVRALTIVANEEGNKEAERAIYLQLIETVKQGNSLSSALEAANGAFPPLLVNMVRSAEEAGNLSEVFARMSTQYTKEHKLNAKVKSSTLYPKILAALIVVVVAIIVGFVIPQFSEMFEAMDELPLPTVILLGITDFCKNNWLGIIIFVIVFIVAWKMCGRFRKFRIFIDRIKLKAPVFGKLNRTICTARFARTFSSLYNSGISAITALQIGCSTIGNAYIESQFDNVIEMVRSGHTLSEAFQTVDGFANKFISSVQVGEESGSLENMLNSTADTLDFESEEAMERMVGILEPMMIVIMAVIVGFVVVAVIVPIYSSYSTIGSTPQSY